MGSFQLGFQKSDFAARTLVRDKIFLSVFLLIFVCFAVHPLSAQTVDVTLNDDNATTPGDLNEAVLAVNGSIDNAIAFQLSSPTITLGSVAGGLNTISLTNSVTFSFGGLGFQPFLVGNPTTSTTAGGNANLLSTTSLVFNSGLVLGVTGGEVNNINSGISGNAVAGNAAVTASSMTLLGSTLNVAGGEILNVDSFISQNATTGNALVAAGSVSLGNSTLTVAGGEIYTPGTITMNVTAGSAAVTAGLVSLTGSTLSVTGGEVDNDDGFIGGNAAGGSAWVTAGSINLSGSTLSVAGGEAYGADEQSFAGTFSGGSAAVTANAVTLGGTSLLSVTGGEAVNNLAAGGNMESNANGGNASVTLNSVNLSGTSTLSVAGGEAFNYDPTGTGFLDGSFNAGNASVTLNSAALSGTSNLSVAGGEVSNSDSEIKSPPTDINFTAGNASVTAGSVSMTGSSFSVAGGEADNNGGAITSSFAITFTAGNAAVTADSVTLGGGSVFSVTGGEVDDSGANMTGKAAAGSAWVTAGSVSMTGSTAGVTGGEAENNSGTIGGNAAAGNASVTAGSMNLTGSTLNLTGGEVDNTSGTINGSVTAGNASVTAVSLAMTGSTLNATGGELNNFGGSLITVGPITGSASVSAGSITLADSNLNVTGGELIQGGGGSIAGALRGNASLTATSVTLDGTSNLSVIGGGIIGLAGVGDATVSIGSLNGSGTVTVSGLNLSDLKIASGNFSGVIAGNEVLETSAGLTLSGANTYSGGTSINGGTLVAANSSALGTGNVSVSAGATLAVSGPLALNIGGNYTQASTGTLQLGLGGATSGLYDSLNITGTATLGGTLKLASYSGFQLHDNENFILLTAGSVTGTFNSVVNGVGGVTGRLVYNASDVILNAPSNAPSFTALGQTGNQKSVGAALDNIATNASNNSLISYLNTLPNSSFPGVEDQMSPSNLTPMFKMGFATAQVEAGMIGQRLSQMLGNSHFVSDMAYANGPMFVSAMPADQEAQIAQSVQPEQWGAFANGMGNFGTVGSDGNGAGYQFSTGGTTAGVDYRFAKDLVAGLMIGYDQSGTSQSTGTVNVSGGQLGLYAGWKSGQLHIDALVDGGLDSYTTARTGLGGTANGTTSGAEYTGQLNVGYDLKAEDYQVSPFVSGQLTQLNVNGFTETGSLAPLTYANQGEAYVSSNLGAQVSRSWTVSGIKLSPNVSAAWEHIYQGNADALTANLGTGNNFTVSGSVTGTDDAVLGAGLNAEFAKGLNVYASYQGEVGLTNYTDQNISGGVNFGF